MVRRKACRGPPRDLGVHGESTGTTHMLGITCHRVGLVKDDNFVRRAWIATANTHQSSHRAQSG